MGEPVSDSTRRAFLVAAGAGAAAIGVATVAPAAQAAPTKRGATSEPAPSDEPLVAYVSDPGKGELTLLIGEREVLVKDRDLVTRLAHAAS